LPKSSTWPIFPYFYDIKELPLCNTSGFGVSKSTVKMGPSISKIGENVTGADFGRN